MATKQITKVCVTCGEPFLSYRSSPKKSCTRACYYRKTPEQRFWEKVAPITRATDCWIWVGTIVGGTGYGKIEIDYRTLRAHRYIWELVHGSIPEGLCVLHKCDNPSCVNPHHMRLGTHAENIADKMQKRRQAKGAAIGNAILTDDIVRAIRADTSNTRAIARKYGITRLHVNVIKRRVSWQHVS